MKSVDIVDNFESKIKVLLERGAPINSLIKIMSPNSISDHLDFLVDCGADPNGIVPRLDCRQIFKNSKTLLAHKANPDEIVSGLLRYVVKFEYLDLDVLPPMKYGVNEVVSELRASKASEARQVVENLTLLAHGAKIKINVDKLVSELDYRQLIRNLRTLLAHGANPDKIVSKLYLVHINENLETLLAHGADANKIALKLGSWEDEDVDDYLDTLLEHGADPDRIVSKLQPRQIVEKLETLLAHGADPDRIVSELQPEQLTRNLKTLLAHRADPDRIVSKLQPEQIVEKLETLLAHGADPDRIVSELQPWEIAINFEYLIAKKADIKNLVNKAGIEAILKRWDPSLENALFKPLQFFLSKHTIDQVVEALKQDA